MQDMETIIQAVEEAVKAHEAALEETTAKVNDAKWRKDVATERMNTAVAANDDAAFKEAKDFFREAEDDLDMAERRIQVLKEAGPVPKKDVDAIMRSILAQVNTVDVEAAKAICDHLDAVNVIADEAHGKCEKLMVTASKIVKLLHIGVDSYPEIRSARFTGTYSKVKKFVSGNVCIEKYRQNFIGPSYIAALAKKAVK